jgi:outer membrane protein assembly factor BamB
VRGVSGRLQPRSVLLRVFIALIVSGLAGAAIWLQIQGWSSLGSESGGACGTRYGACPPGSTPVLVGSFLVAFVAIPAALFTWRWRPQPLFSLLLVIGLVGGGFAGQAAFTGLHGASFSVKWSTPFDGPNNLATQGVWVQGGSVVRVRIDEVESYADTTGAAQWTFPIPGQDVVCAVSKTSAGSVGVLAYGAQNAPCGHLVAIDLTTGRPLWATDVPTDGQEPPPIDDFVAAAGNLVVTRVGDQVVAFDARTGTQRWTRSSSSGCQVQFVAADPSAVVGIAACQNGYLVSDLDPATGVPRWETPVVEPSYQLALLSVTPVVVSDLVPGALSVDNVRVFTAQGASPTMSTVTTTRSPSAWPPVANSG